MLSLSQVAHSHLHCFSWGRGVDGEGITVQGVTSERGGWGWYSKRGLPITDEEAVQSIANGPICDDEGEGGGGG